MNNVRLKCSHCGGPKFIGERYYNGGVYYVDITCVVCAHTKDIKVSDLEIFLTRLSRQRGEDVKKQTRNK